MKEIYIIVSTDRYDHRTQSEEIIEVWTNHHKALMRCGELNKENTLNTYVVQNYGLDITQKEYIEEKYGTD